MTLVQLLEQISKNALAEKALAKSGLEGKLAGKTGTFVSALSPKVKNTMKNFSGINTALGYGTLIVDFSKDVSETLALYAALDVGFMEYIELDEFLGTIVKYSENSELIIAASDLREALLDDYGKCLSQTGMILNDIGESGLELAYLITMMDAGPLGWAMEAGWSIGDMMFNTGKINEELLSVIAYGDAAVSYSEALNYIIRYDNSPYYYVCEQSMLDELQILGQLRVVGENKYAEASNERSLLVKWIGSFVECSQQDIEELCLDVIEEVIWRCNTFKVTIYKKYNGCYFK